MVTTLVVNLAARAYPIHFGAELQSAVVQELNALKEAGRRVVVVTDQQVARAQAGRLDAMFTGLPGVVVAAGEASKSLETFGQVLDFLAEQRIDRTGVVFAVGGGVVGDLAGYAAAAYLRGIAYYQVPTTLLAMVDSSVGGKTGINLKAGKNLVGAFHQPRAVFVDTAFLQTLPPREFAAGLAEVIKYGLLGDAELYRELAARPLQVGDERLAEVIRRCCAAKAHVVQADEFEQAKDGGRALLNLGHTFGHAIEQVAGYGQYLHGEAVAIGLVAAAHLSQRLGYLDDASVDSIRRTVAAHHLPVQLRAPLPVADLMAAMQRDKKVRAGRLRFVLLREIGRAATQDDIDPNLVTQLWGELGAE